MRLPKGLWSRLVLVPMGLLFASCLSQSVAGVGEGPIPPADAFPVVSIAVVDDSGEPVANALLTVADATVQADVSGIGALVWQGRPITVNISAPGFFPGAVEVAEFLEEPLLYSLRPVVLKGSVTDGKGEGLAGARVLLGDESVLTDGSGGFSLERAVPGALRVERPGWFAAEVNWSGDDLIADVELQPMTIRGLHVGGVTLGSSDAWEEILTIADETVVNALVVDLKDESGRVYYNSNVEFAREIGAVQPTFELELVVAEMAQRDLYAIGRIVTFQDPLAARARPSMAATDTSTNAPYQKNGQYFLDPTDVFAREYALDLAAEACAAGLDEIQFDYVRYPDGFSDAVVFDGGSSQEARVAAISEFLMEARDRLHPLGCAVAADIFGFITSVSGDGGIGQQFDQLVEVADVVSPMIYPSHYSAGWFGYNVPNNNPGPVVAGALTDGLERADGPAIVRPWLQDFFYDSSQVRAQIEEAESRSVGWMLWNAASRFQTDALDPSTGGSTPPTTAPPVSEPDSQADSG